ncbi:MAG TPA: class I SAM-dependent methyltransferase [Anaerolineales bacterium]|nr:class I SAM-dependent methyltransferase [Anaerolineales bacterium]
MKPVSLFELGIYSLEWIKDFYTQAGEWWGVDPQAPGVHKTRVEMVARLCGSGSKRILELGAGTGVTAAALADAGHNILAVELSPTRAELARHLAKIPRKGAFAILEGDFYTMELNGRFDVICCWETFGLGTDADQRRLLKRIADEWLGPNGSILTDVYSPIRPARDAGTERRLPPLKGVPGSVEMINRCHFDPLHGSWIDEWIPVAEPEKALAQAIRCYMPSDFLLLLEGTGLVIKHAEVEGQALDVATNAITAEGPLMDAWCYLVQLTLDN